jgi:hypothetical protein
MEGAGDLGAKPLLPRDGIEALKAAKDRLRETLQNEVQTLEEALHTEYNKVEAAFEGLAVEAARQTEHAVSPREPAPAGMGQARSRARQARRRKGSHGGLAAIPIIAD